MFNVRAKLSLLGFPVNLRDEEEVPGFHVQSPEDDVPGFRLNADGSIRDTKAPAAALYPDIRNNPFYSFDQPGLYGNAVMPIGDGSPSPYLAYARGLYNGLGGPPALGADVVQSSMSPSAPPFSRASPFNSLPIAEATTGGHPFVPSPQFLRKWPAFDNGQRPSAASFNYSANASPVFGRRSPLASTGPISDEGVSMAEADAANAVARDVGQASGGHGVDPNIIRVADPLSPTNRNDPIPSPTPRPDDPGAEGFNPIPSAKAPTPTSKLHKDPSPGVPVVLPDRSTVIDPQSPTGLLMAPVADLGDVAAAGREARREFRALAVTPVIAHMYRAATLGLNVGHGGTFDYQRRGNKITGYTHLQQFEKVSNLNVGLFAQQAGLTLEQVLEVAGKFARNLSNNSDPNRPYGLSANQLEFITLGYKIGESGVFDKPPMP